MTGAKSFLNARVANGSSARGNVAAPSVRWPAAAANRRNVNALVSERLTDIGGGPTFYSCLVQIEKVEGASRCVKPSLWLPF